MVVSGHESVTLDSSDFSSGCAAAAEEADAKARQDQTGQRLRDLAEHDGAGIKRLFEIIVVNLQPHTLPAADRVVAAAFGTVWHDCVYL